MNDNYLRRIRQTYYVQVRVPRPLVPRLGKQHLLKCTKTRDILEARRRRHAIVAKFHQLIDAARQLQVSHEGGIVGELLDEAALMRRQINAGQLKREKVVGVTDYDPETGKLLEVPGAWKLMLERPERLPLSALSDAQSLADVHDTHLELPEAKSDAGLRKLPWHPLARPLVQRLVETSTDGYLVAGQRPAASGQRAMTASAVTFSSSGSHISSREDTEAAVQCRAAWAEGKLHHPACSAPGPQERDSAACRP